MRSRPLLRPPASRLLPRADSHTTTQLTHTQVIHTQLTHTHTSHTHATYSHGTHTHTTYSHTAHINTTPSHTTLSYTQTFTLHGRRGTWQHRPSLCAAGVALVARLVPVCRRGRRGCLSGRCGIWKHRPPFRPSLCVACVTLIMALGWLWWCAWFPFVGSRGTWQYRLPLCMVGHLATSTFTLRGRRGTYGTGLALVARLVSVCRHCRRAVCVARVAFGSIDLHSVWQAWHLATSTFTLCGRRDTCGTVLALVALFLWEVWRLATSISTLCGRCGTWRHRPSLCVAGVALMALGWLWWRAWFPVVAVGPRLFVWQAWHLEFGSIDLHSVWKVWHLATSTIYLTHRAKRQPSASAKNLLQAVRSHDGLRGLLGHIAHAAKTNGCHSPLFMVLARRLWLHNI